MERNVVPLPCADDRTSFAEAYEAGFAAGLRGGAELDGRAESYLVTQVLARTYRIGLLDGQRARHRPMLRSA